MHLPDGLINNAVNGPLLGAAAVFAGYAVSKLRASLLRKRLIARKRLALAEGDVETGVEQKWELTNKGKEKLLIMASVGAFIFAAQMMNFNVAEGTSGHFIGAALATIALGRFAGMIIISVILTIQAFLFGDGGIVALGSNIINLAVIGSFVSFVVFDKCFKMPDRKTWKFYLGIFIAAWLSVMAASFAASIELMISGQGGMSMISSMMGVHALIGIGEGLITLCVITFFFKKLIR